MTVSVLADRQPGVVGAAQLLRGDARWSAVKALDDPATELVAVGVVEPPDGLPVGRDDAGHGPLASIGYLPALPGGAIPGVDLPAAGLVRAVDEAVRRVVRPLGQDHARSTKSAAPLCFFHRERG